jgi:hypothetical protein
MWLNLIHIFLWLQIYTCLCYNLKVYKTPHLLFVDASIHYQWIPTSRSLEHLLIGLIVNVFGAAALSYWLINDSRFLLQVFNDVSLSWVLYELYTNDREIKNWQQSILQIMFSTPLFIDNHFDGTLLVAFTASMTILFPLQQILIYKDIDVNKMDIIMTIISILVLMLWVIHFQVFIIVCIVSPTFLFSKWFLSLIIFIVAFEFNINLVSKL